MSRILESPDRSSNQSTVVRSDSCEYHYVGIAGVDYGTAASVCLRSLAFTFSSPFFNYQLASGKHVGVRFLRRDSISTIGADSDRISNVSFSEVVGRVESEPA